MSTISPRAAESVKLDNDIADVLYYDAELETVCFTSSSGDEYNRYTLYVGGYSSLKDKLISDANSVDSVWGTSCFYTTHDDGGSSLYYYSGEDKELITNNLASLFSSNARYGIAVYSEYDKKDKTETTMYIGVAGGVVEEIDAGIIQTAVAEDGSCVFITEGEGEDVELVRYAVHDSGPGDRDVISDNCYRFDYVPDTNTLFYVEDIDDDFCGSLYEYTSADGSKLIGDDVYVNTQYFQANNGSMFLLCFRRRAALLHRLQNGRGYVYWIWDAQPICQRFLD